VQPASRPMAQLMKEVPPKPGGGGGRALGASSGMVHVSKQVEEGASRVHELPQVL